MPEFVKFTISGSTDEIVLRTDAVVMVHPPEDDPRDSDVSVILYGTREVPGKRVMTSPHGMVDAQQKIYVEGTVHDVLAKLKYPGD